MTERSLPPRHENAPLGGERFRTVSGKDVFVTSVLGRSSRSVIYRARVPGLQTPDEEVAVKMIRVQSRDSKDFPLDALRREKTVMIEEGRIMAKLSGHPNILHLFGAEEVSLPEISPHKAELGSLPVLITQMAEPRNLGNSMSEMTNMQKVRAMVDIGDALTYAHDKNIVHGDVKVSNVLRTPARWILGDWGMADDLNKLENPDQVMMVRGTLYAIAPERLSGRVQAENDVYSMGVLMHTLLTGKIPFPDIPKNNLADYEEAHRLRRFPSLRSLGIRAPKLQQIISDASEKEPENRPSMREVTSQIFDVYLRGENKKLG